MNIYLSECLGTFLLILAGNGSVANVLLKGTKGENSGFLLIATAWGLAVFLGVMVAGQFSGAHINPAVTLSLAIAGKFEWALVPGYIFAQMIGAMIGAVTVFTFYYPHYKQTENVDFIRATFCTSPAIRNSWSNFFSEFVGTIVLILAVLYLVGPSISIDGKQQVMGLGSLDALPIGLVVWVIGMSLGGTTGYAINPARDLGPRIIHSFIPLKSKGTSDWKYAWIPIVGPISGGFVAVIIYLLLGSSS